MTETRLPEHAPAVVIGGGITGASALYHLGKRGVEGAVLVERKQLASGTTWHAAGIVGQLRESGAQTALSKYTARLFTELESETGQATGYKQNGTIHVALSDVRLEQLRRNHDHAERMDIESHLLDVAQLREKWPLLEYDGVLGGFFVPSNGQVNPLDVTQAFARGARQNGGSIFEHTKAIRILTSNGRVSGVETDRGTIATEKILLAGGMWTARFAKAHGVVVPLHAAEHFYIVTEPIPGLPRTLPGLVVLEERIYAKEDAGKLLIGGFEARGKAWARQGVPEDFEFDQLPFDLEHVEPVLDRIFARMPALSECGIQTFFNGPESFTPDGRPYLGPAPEMPGLFIAAGMNSNGILNSGGVGLTLAEWIADGIPSRGMGSMLAARAHPFQANESYNAERVTEAVGLHWGLHWPGRQVETARGVRRVLLHDRLKQQGAVFAERVGWEVPMYYDPSGSGWPAQPSIGWQEWFLLVEQECLAARDGAALLDQSMYGKILVQGPDAVRALNRVSGAEMDVPVGSSVYAQFLNPRGGIEADVTATRIAPQKFIVITGHPSQIRDQAWIRAHADPDWRFEIFDATSAYSLLSIHGPDARAILSSVSMDDLSEEAFPFGAAREIDLAYARVWAIRRSFLGELGYELLMPTEFTAGVYEALLAAGEPHGMRHIGMFAMNHCRMEKAFRHFGHDIGEDDTPYETGLGFAVKLDKAEPFIGREALAKQKAGGSATTYRTVALAIDGASRENGPFLIHNEPIRRQGQVVGHVTSGAWGFRLGKSLGVASLHNREGVSKPWIEEGGFTVRVAGKDYAVAVQLTPFYDPAGERMRGLSSPGRTTTNGNDTHGEQKTILVIGTYDTKSDELRFLQDCIERQGGKVLTMDVSVLGDAPLPADISKHQVAEAAGSSIRAIAASGDENAAMQTMAAGAAKLTATFYADRKIDGMIAIGGTMGTDLALDCARALPLGVPKYLVSTIAFSPLIPTDRLSADIQMILWAGGLYGLNDICKATLSQAAGAVLGAAQAAVPPDPDRPVIGMLSFGSSALKYMVHLRQPLIDRGFSVAVFHGTGMGGMAMESLAEQGYFAAVLELAVAEIGSLVVGSMINAGAKRMTAAGRRGIPIIAAPGFGDMIDVPTWQPVPERFRDRPYHAHNRLITSVSLSAEERRELAREVSRRLKAAKGPVHFVLPTRGVHAWDTAGMPAHDPAALAEMVDEYTKVMNDPIRLSVVDCHINDLAFSEKIIEIIDGWIADGTIGTTRSQCHAA